MKAKQRWVITPDKFLSSEQVEKVVGYLLSERDLARARANNPQGIKDYYMVRTLLESGLRCFEFCALTLGDFHGHKLAVRHGKGDKPRTVVLTKATALMLKEWLGVRESLGFTTVFQSPLFPSRYGTQYTTRGVQKRIELIFAAVGLPGSLSTHSTRHTYCSHLLESGKVGLPTVKENMGHSSISTTNLYSHAVANLDGVELYSSSSHFYMKQELGSLDGSKNRNGSAKRVLRKTNFKQPEPRIKN
jgi:site-specific recombinase XerD